MASFIDNIIIGTEIEEGHNKLVEKVVRKLAENNLYVKPEKCKWKFRKVDVKIVESGLCLFYFSFLFLFFF